MPLPAAGRDPATSTQRPHRAAASHDRRHCLARYAIGTACASGLILLALACGLFPNRAWAAVTFFGVFHPPSDEFSGNQGATTGSGPYRIRGS